MTKRQAIPGSGPRAPNPRRGCPRGGPGESGDGTVIRAPNLGGRDVPLARQVSNALGGVPGVVLNDARAATLVELWLGAGAVRRTSGGSPYPATGGSPEIRAHSSISARAFARS